MVRCDLVWLGLGSEGAWQGEATSRPRSVLPYNPRTMLRTLFKLSNSAVDTTSKLAAGTTSRSRRLTSVHAAPVLPAAGMLLLD